MICYLLFVIYIIPYHLSEIIDNSVIVWYNSDIMTNYKLISFSGIDFQLAADKAVHTADFPKHSHDFTELTVVTGGTATHVIEGVRHPIQRGTVMSVNPNFTHEYAEVNKLEHYNFMFDISKLSLMESELKKLRGFQTFFVTLPEHRYRHKFISTMLLNEEQLEFTKNLCELIYNEFTEKTDGCKIRARIYFLSLIAYLSSLYNPTEESISENISKIIHTAEYIEENYSEKITVEQLADMAYLSQRQYLRVFRSIYGMSPKQYIIKCRLDHSCELIRNSSQTMTEIASVCGFSDKSSFSKLFHKEFGITPGGYKKQI